MQFEIENGYDFFVLLSSLGKADLMKALELMAFVEETIDHSYIGYSDRIPSPLELEIMNFYTATFGYQLKPLGKNKFAFEDVTNKPFRMFMEIKDDYSVPEFMDIFSKAGSGRLIKFFEISDDIRKEIAGRKRIWNPLRDDGIIIAGNVNRGTYTLLKIYWEKHGVALYESGYDYKQGIFKAIYLDSISIPKKKPISSMKKFIKTITTPWFLEWGAALLIPQLKMINASLKEEEGHWKMVIFPSLEPILEYYCIQQGFIPELIIRIGGHRGGGIRGIYRTEIVEPLNLNFIRELKQISSKI